MLLPSQACGLTLPHPPVSTHCLLRAQEQEMGRQKSPRKSDHCPYRETPCSELPGPSGEGRPVEGQTFPNMTQSQLRAGLAAEAAEPILGLGSLSPGQQVQRLGARHLPQHLFWGIPGLRPRDQSQLFT